MYSQGLYEVEGKTLKYPFFILPELKEDYIVGIDFIKTFQLHLCLKHHHFHWQPTCPQENLRTISCTKEIFLPPNSTSLIPVQIEAQSTDKTNRCLIAEINLPLDNRSPITNSS
jgi:hypothetical protein